MGRKAVVSLGPALGCCLWLPRYLSSAVAPPSASRRSACLLAECLDSSVHIPADVFLRFFYYRFPDPEKGREGPPVRSGKELALAATAAQFALGGYTVILDGPMFPYGADGVAEICGRHDVLVHYAVLRADLPTCLERAKQRDPAGPPDLGRVHGTARSITDLGESEANAIDASGNAEQVVTRRLVRL